MASEALRIVRILCEAAAQILAVASSLEAAVRAAQPPVEVLEPSQQRQQQPSPQRQRQTHRLRAALERQRSELEQQILEVRRQLQQQQQQQQQQQPPTPRRSRSRTRSPVSRPVRVLAGGRSARAVGRRMVQILRHRPVQADGSRSIDGLAEQIGATSAEVRAIASQDVTRAGSLRFEIQGSRIRARGGHSNNVSLALLDEPLESDFDSMLPEID